MFRLGLGSDVDSRTTRIVIICLCGGRRCRWPRSPRGLDSRRRLIVCPDLSFQPDQRPKPDLRLIRSEVTRAETGDGVDSTTVSESGRLLRLRMGDLGSGQEARKVAILRFIWHGLLYLICYQHHHSSRDVCYFPHTATFIARGSRVGWVYLGDHACHSTKRPSWTPAW